MTASPDFYTVIALFLPPIPGSSPVIDEIPLLPLSPPEGSFRRLPQVQSHCTVRRPSHVSWTLVRASTCPVIATFWSKMCSLPHFASQIDSSAAAMRVTWQLRARMPTIDVPDNRAGAAQSCAQRNSAAFSV
ncbi:hypothetical protein DFH06DRAFT_1330919 [Mycena polygramma]|nr:hypothetical protein DFH06DRAFT_1330919 [Mycena polygramma]